MINPNIIIRDLSRVEWDRAVNVACKYLIDYPGRLGIRNGCVYSNSRNTDLYVYRTKTAVVVRPTKKD